MTNIVVRENTGFTIKVQKNGDIIQSPTSVPTLRNIVGIVPNLINLDDVVGISVAEYSMPIYNASSGFYEIKSINVDYGEF